MRYNSNGNLVNGTTNITIPNKDDSGNVFEVGEYKIRIDYESTNASKPEAYQLSRKLVVGYRPVFSTSTAKIVFSPYYTTATSESAITTAEKLATHYDNITLTVKNKSNNQLVKQLPLTIKFGVGDNFNYLASDVQPTKRLNSFQTAKKIKTVTTDDNGQVKFNIAVSEVFTNDTVSQSLGEHTLFIGCEGVANGSNSYVPEALALPCIFGTSNVRVAREVTPDDGDNITPIVCGGGSFLVEWKNYFAWAFKDNKIKEGYEYFSNEAGMVYKGKVKVEVWNNSTNQYELCSRDDMGVHSGCKSEVTEDGYITLPRSRTGNIENYFGNCSFFVYNSLPANYTGNWKIRVQYIGVAGYTFSTNPVEITVKVAPNNPSYHMTVNVSINDKDSANTLTVLPVDPRQITVSVKNKRNGANISSGTLQYELKQGTTVKHSGTASISNGTARFTIPAQQIGVYTLTAKYVDGHGDTYTDTATYDVHMVTPVVSVFNPEDIPTVRNRGASVGLGITVEGIGDVDGYLLWSYDGGVTYPISQSVPLTNGLGTISLRLPNNAKAGEQNIYVKYVDTDGTTTSDGTSYVTRGRYNTKRLYLPVFVRDDAVLTMTIKDSEGVSTVTGDVYLDEFEQITITGKLLANDGTPIQNAKFDLTIDETSNPFASFEKYTNANGVIYYQLNTAEPIISNKPSEDNTIRTLLLKADPPEPNWVGNEQTLKDGISRTIIIRKHITANIKSVETVPATSTSAEKIKVTGEVKTREGFKLKNATVGGLIRSSDTLLDRTSEEFISDINAGLESTNPDRYSKTTTNSEGTFVLYFLKSSSVKYITIALGAVVDRRYGQFIRHVTLWDSTNYSSPIHDEVR